MSSKIVVRRKISSITSATYTLTFENNEYSIACVEQNEEGSVTDFAKVKCITSSEERAKEIFSKITKNKVCACTLCDVVCDLIC